MKGLEKKKLQLQLMKMDTNILEYEVKIEERMNDIQRIEKQIEMCKEHKKEIKKELES